MPKRTTPRNPEEAVAIARALRKKFISPEAQATAKRLLAGQAAGPPPEKPFSERERRRAAEILDTLRGKYKKPH